ncbi:MAG: hypothetical protein GF398_12535 [Chitinivibrionales bacterium]|nr:hypothetical protein [Chitinivibrionales bacterium]
MSPIGPLSQGYPLKAYASVAAQGNRTVSETQKSGTKKESVEFSASSRDLQIVYDKLNEAADMRIPIVKEIQERIKNNDYPLENRLNKALEIMYDKSILVPAYVSK